MHRFGLVVIAALLVGCDEGGGEPSSDAGVVSKSQAGSLASHFEGRNCMECHRPGGTAKSAFTAAGTAYIATGTPHGEGFVKIARDPEGANLVATLEIDGKGNFYTTDPLPIPSSQVFYWVESRDGRRNKMPFPTISGACNFCHTQSKRVFHP